MPLRHPAFVPQKRRPPRRHNRSYYRWLRLESLEDRRLLAPFSPGNLVAVRVGELFGQVNNSAAPVFIDEFDSGGFLLQSIPLPTEVKGNQRRLTATRNNLTEGMLSRSTDGRYLLVTGYDAPVGSTSPSGATSSSVNRVVARIDALGIIDTSTVIPDGYNANAIRGAASADGSTIFVSGGGTSNTTGGIRQVAFGGSTSTQISTVSTDTRAIDFVAGQLFVSANPAPAAGGIRVAQVVAPSFPTSSGHAIINLPFSGGTVDKPFQFFAADLESSVPGPDTLYVADEADGAGVRKFSLVGSAWVYNGNVSRPGLGLGVRGLTGKVEAGGVTVYASETLNADNSIFKLVDTSGWNGTLTAPAVTYADGIPGAAYRGLALAPVAAAPTATTEVALVGGNLAITDVGGDNTNDTLTISRLTGPDRIRVLDPNSSLSAGAGLTQVNANTVDVPWASITGGIVISTEAGNDTLTVDLSGGDAIPSGNISFHGGLPTSGAGDKLTILGGSQGSVTYTCANAHDGSVSMSSFGTVTYTGLEPIVNTGTAADVVFNLPSGPNSVVLGDDGTSNPLSRISGPTIETTDFVSPSNSLRINSADLAIAAGANGIGSAAVPLTISGGPLVTDTNDALDAPQFLAAASGIIIGDGDLDAGTATITLSSGAFVTTSSGSIVSPLTVASGATLAGTGTASAVVVETGGVVAPGQLPAAPIALPGILSVTNVAYASGAAFNVELGGVEPGTQHDQIAIAGGANLGGATLNLALGFTPAIGDAFTIIRNDSLVGIGGAFDGLPEGKTFSVATGAFSGTFQITYQGNDGNDVVLTALNANGTTGVTASLVGSNLVIAGTPANDTIVVDQLGDTVRVLDQLSVVFSAQASAVNSAYVTAGDGHDRITVDASFGIRPTTVLGNAGNDKLIGGAGNDRLTGGSGGDSFDGGGGDDYLVADALDTAGIVHILGGNGADYLNFSAETAGITFDNNAVATGGFETIYGTGGNDNITNAGSANAIYIAAFGGDDVLIGGHGNDHIDGGAGNDSLMGNGGHDRLIGAAGIDTFDGGEGNDYFIGDAADMTVGIGTPKILGGSGSDYLNLSAETIGVAFDNTAANTGGFETIYGTGGNDTITNAGSLNPIYIAAFGGDDILIGGDGSDHLDAGPGSDSLIANGGHDRLIGAAGSDTFDGGDGNDHIVADAADTTAAIPQILGGNGTDFLNFSGEFIGVTFDNGAVTTNGFETIYGGGGNDNITAAGSLTSVYIATFGGNDVVIGGSGNDYIDGGDGDDRLFGGDGNDALRGAGGNDFVAGNAGNDRLDGNAGNDVLIGGLGADVIFGDIGNDMLLGGRVSVASPVGNDTSANLGDASDLAMSALVSDWSADGLLNLLVITSIDDGESDYLSGLDGTDAASFGPGDIGDWENLLP